MTKWEEVQARIKAELAKEAAEQQEKQELDSGEIPFSEEVSAAAPEFDSDRQRQVADIRAEEDAALKGLDIVSVYKRLTGRDVKRSGGKGERLVFCPAEDHDNHNTEAACINLEKRTWVCYGQCENGGGVVDMVAAAYGMPWGKALKGKDYAKAKQKTLEDFCGWIFRDGVGKSPAQQKAEEQEFEKEFGKLPDLLPEDTDDLPTIIAPINRRDFGVNSGPIASTSSNAAAQVEAILTAQPEPVKPEAQPVSPSPEELAKVLPIRSDLNELTEYADGVEILPEIEGVFDHIPQGTPLYEYMVATASTVVPTEYDLFRGLQLLGMCGGAFVRGKVGAMFKPTLSVVFVGLPGAGKSQSRMAMNAILDHIVFKWTSSPPAGGLYASHHGVKRLFEPGSGEFLLKELSEDVIAGAPFEIRDCVADLDIDEFARFIGKANMQGSSLATVVQAFENSADPEHTITAGSRSGGKVSAVNPNVTFTSGVQPNVLGELIGKGGINSGLLSRFEIVTGNKRLSDDVFSTGLGSMTHAQALYTDAAVFYEGKTTLSDDTRQLLVIEVHPDAQQKMNTAANRIGKMGFSDPLKSRFDLKLFKLSLLFAMNRQATAIMEGDIEAALWVMEFLDRSMTLAGKKLVSTLGSEIETAIVDAVRVWTRKIGYATTGRIFDRVRPESKGWDPDLVRRRIQALEDAGTIIPDPRSAKRGPRSIRYIIPEELEPEQQTAFKKAMKEQNKGDKK